MTTSKPSDLPDNPVRKPTAHRRSVAAQLLDTFDDLSPEAQLLRTLLDDDQPAFEQALTARLEQYRAVAEPDGRPRSLLPIGTIAVAALAVQAHGWELGIRSGYLPNGLLRAPGLVRPR
ncbi:Imm49 family immunity protein [Nocardia fusca]|uniref:Imm49 family immunity protein n=1 Tax=Nocardia fusca TaxID=941183 RepID=UPI0037AA9599